MGTLRIGDTEVSCPLAAGDRPGRCSWCAGPLTGRRTRWCSDDCAYAYADQHFWTSARRAALERAGYRCERCEARPPRLEVHHRVEVDPATGYATGCAHHGENLEVLCSGCHRAEHSFRHEVERLLTWAEAITVTRQLVLPGIAA